MRWMGATLLLIGCVTSGEVREARVNHVSCLDRQADDMRAAKSMAESAARTRAIAADCWRVFHSQVSLGVDAARTELDCRQLDVYAVLFDDRTRHYGSRLSETATSCQEMGTNAEQLATWLDRYPH
jgi:hypothetical protein